MIKSYKEKIQTIEQQLEWYREVGIKGKAYRDRLAEIERLQEKIIIESEVE
jgi:cytochrome c-type biogenesis protein CcmH/NrfG